ncbi:MAG: DUF6265 family protein [Lysobacterales bacterium]
MKITSRLTSPSYLRRTFSNTLLLLLTGMTGAIAAPLDWMNGRWCTPINDDVTTEEHWLSDAGGRLLGVNRTLRDGRAVAFEFLQIDLQSQPPVYLAQPGGRTATAFSRVTEGSQWVRFENLQHDYPQYIEYRREGASLTATIGAGEGHDRRESAIAFDRCAQASGSRPPSDANAMLVKRYVEAYNQCDLAEAAKLMHPDIQWLNISGAELTSAANDKDQLVAELESYMANGCSVRSELSQWSVNERFVTVKETAHWTTDDGSAQSQSATAVYEIADQKILNVWYYPAIKRSQ